MENSFSKNMLKVTAFATTLALMAGTLSMSAFAEVAYNCDNLADQELF